MKKTITILAVIILTSSITYPVAMAQYIPIVEPSSNLNVDPSLQINLTKKYFMPWENIRLDYTGEAKPLTVKVLNADQQEIQFQGVLRQEGDKKYLDIEIPKNIKPGKYHILIKDGEKVLVDQDVFWGKTVINKKTSVLKQGQVGNTNLVFFSEKGDLICNSDKQALLKNLITSEEKTESLTKPADCSTDKKTCDMEQFCKRLH